MEQNKKTYEELVEENTSLNDKVAELEENMAELNRQLAVLKKMAFGSKSEKTKAVETNADQMSLFNEAESEQSTAAREEEKELVVKGYTRKKKRSKDEIWKDLPIEEVVHEVENKVCPECGTKMEVIGKEYLHEELVYVPAKIFRRKHFAEVVKCPDCGEFKEISKSEKTVIVKGEAPKTVFPKSYCSPELLTHILYEKYVKAVPLERLSKDFKSMKAEISTATLANWVIEAANRYFKPIYNDLHRKLLSQEVIHADETVVQVLREKNRKPTTESRMWVYCTDKIKLYDYQPTRKGENAVQFLNGYTGFLVCDGYDGYNKLKSVTRCGCWAHTRRKFVEAIPADEELKKTSKAAIALEKINKIFELEKQFKEMPEKERYERRQKQIKPVVDDFYAYLETLNPVQGSGLAKAVQYAKNEKQYLYAFLKNPNVPIDNNLAERTVKPFVIGRKNWLFSTSPKGAQASAIIYSVMNTAQANGLDVKEYLNTVFLGTDKPLLN